MMLSNDPDDNLSNDNKTLSSKPRPLVPTIRFDHQAATMTTREQSKPSKCPLYSHQAQPSSSTTTCLSKSLPSSSNSPLIQLNSPKSCNRTKKMDDNFNDYNEMTTISRSRSSSTSTSASMSIIGIADIGLVDFGRPVNSFLLPPSLGETSKTHLLSDENNKSSKTTQTSVIHNLVIPNNKIKRTDLSSLDREYIKQKKACMMAYGQQRQYQQKPTENQDKIHPNSSTNQQHLDATIMAVGLGTMFSSESLLTMPMAGGAAMTGCYQQFKQNAQSFDGQQSSDKVWENGTRTMNGGLGYLPANQSPLTSHPLISETRTRALSRAKLKQSSQVSALLSGFALVAMVEMDINSPSTIPLPVLMFFIITTTLLVSVHMIALMISTCILPHIESMNAMQDLALTLGSNQSNPIINDQHLIHHGKSINDLDQVPPPTTSSAGSTLANTYGEPPHQKMRLYISIAWFFSTVIGIFLFILELVAIVWVKFWDHNRSPNEDEGKIISDGKMIATISTLLLIPVLLSLIYFAFHFYRKLVLLRYEMTQRVLDELNIVADNLTVCDHV